MNEFIWMKLIMMGYLAFQAYRDAKTKNISVISTIIFGVIEIIILCVSGNASRIDIICGMFVGVVVIAFSIVTHQMIGSGDGAVMINVGIMTGWMQCLIIFMNAVFLAAILSLVLIVCKRVHRKDKIPLIPFILIAYIGIV